MKRAHSEQRGDVKELLVMSVMLGSSPSNLGKTVWGNTNIMLRI